MLSKHTSIRTTLIQLILGVSFSMFLLFVTFTLSYNFYNQKKSFIAESKLETAMIADFCVTPLAFFDQEAAQNNLKLLRSILSVDFAIIYNERSEIFASYNPEKLKQTIKIQNQEVVEFTNEHANILDFGTLNIWYPLKQNDIQYGMIYIQFNTNNLENTIVDMIGIFLMFSVIIVIIVILLTNSLSSRFLSPIIKLIESVSHMKENRNYNTDLKYKGNNEIGTLFKVLNELFKDLDFHQKNAKRLNEELEERVERRTKELEDNVKILQRTQGQLVESEKMAALGALVSGISHEVNTPLGNALTGASIIQHEVRELDKLFNANSLKKSSLEDIIQTLGATSSLLMKTLTQAANLIRSFKKISVDQVHEEKRLFNLHDYVNEIFLTFHNKLKQVPVEVIIRGSESCQINSYPGVFAQIINNMIQNSLLHAFPDKHTSAKIIVTFELLPDDNLLFEFTDNGEGVNESVKEKIFEPFITTKRNAGGTGIGLNIVYNIVAQKLHGTIDMTSSKNTGTTFKLIIPLKKDKR